MSKFSYFPPQTEEEVSVKLNKPLKDIKKLKKIGVLDFKGKLICNLCLEEYINGGCGYDDVLSIKFQSKIDDKIEYHYKSMKFRKAIESQLIKLYERDYLKITYKTVEMMKPTNIYAIKKVEWTEKAKIQSLKVYKKINTDLIKELAYTYHTDNFNERDNKLFKQGVSEIKEYGFVELVCSSIDKEINKLKIKEKEVISKFDKFDKEKKETIKLISKKKNKLYETEYQLSMGFLEKTNLRVKNELDEELLELQNDKNYDELCKEVDKLNVSKELKLWIDFKNNINKRNGFGFSDFVNEFNKSEYSIENNLLSKTDILDLVNESKKLFGMKQITKFESVVKELKQSSHWNYNI